MRIKWDIRGFEEIRRSAEVQDLVGEVTDMVLDRLPRGYGWSGRQGKSRYREIVFAERSFAFRDQVRNNSLQKALFELGGSS